MDIAKLYTTQISMTEWFEKINHKQTATLREEDNKKRERLKTINDITGMPFDEPTQFKATDIAKQTPQFKKFLAEHGDELCALRLLPTDSNMPKLRLRGKTIRETLKWFAEQKIDPAKYVGDFVPHSSVQLFSTIFVVNQHGIFGEIIKGGHYQLTQGFYDKHKPVTFAYDFKSWQISDTAPEYKQELETIIAWLHIKNPDKQKTLQEKLHATFANNYLCGYFETVTNGDGAGLWFVDYNRILGDMFADAAYAKNDQEALLKGQPASKGKASGPVKIVLQKDIAHADINEGDVLVCDITTPDYVQLMRKAAAVVTDRGGILSHAAIVCRELGKPCVAATGSSTTILKNGQMITVDADAGVVKFV